MMHFVIVTLGSADLVALALSSIRRYAPNCMVDLVPLPADTHDARAHGAAIDLWRSTFEGQVLDDDVLVIMDPDVVLLSTQWQREIAQAFEDRHVGIWGAGAQEDFGPRVHAHMMCIRGRVWNTLAATFTPCRDARERTWRDTGGLYCLAAIDAGWRVVPLERGPDWHGVSAWWAMRKGELSGTRIPTPLWAHLGSSTHSDIARLTPWQRIKRRKRIRQRRTFIKAAQAHVR